MVECTKNVEVKLRKKINTTFRNFGSHKFSRTKTQALSVAQRPRQSQFPDKLC